MTPPVLRILASRVTALLTRPRLDARLDEEIQTHLDLLTEDHVRRGLSRGEARAAARRAFGGVEQVKEGHRDQRALPFVDALIQDVRFGARLLVKERWFTLGAVAALALGMAVTNTVFTLVNAALIRNLPFEDPQRVVAIGTRDVRGEAVPGPLGYRGLSYDDYRDWRDAATSFTGMAAYVEATMNVGDDTVAAERYLGAYLSASTFALLGQRPVLGRDFRPEDDRPDASPVVILGHGVWLSRYQADARVLGRTIRVNGVPATVVGVMPAGMGFPETADLWQPLVWLPDVTAQARDARRLSIVGRLANDASLARARTELDAIAERLARMHPATNGDVRATVLPFDEQHVAPQIAVMLLTLMGAVGFVLLVACANVANLLLARSAGRSREMAVRASLGATRWRIVGQLLVEHVLLAVVAGALAFGLSIAGIQLLSRALTSAQRPPYWLQITMDGSVFAFLAAVTLGSAVVFGLVPALHVSKTDLHGALKEGGRIGGGGGLRVRRWAGALVVAELTLTVVLLAGAGFMMRTFLDMHGREASIETAQLTTMRLELPRQKYATAAQRRIFFERLEERLAGVGTVQAVTVASHVPLRGGASRRLEIDGRGATADRQSPRVSVVAVGPRYFETLDVPILRGRGFTEQDGMPGAEAAIVNARFASVYFPGDDPIGRRIRLSPEGEPDGGAPWLTVVGVSPTVVRGRTQGTDAPAAVYLPHRSELGSSAVLIVRDDADTQAVASRLREEVRALDADLPLWEIMTIDEWLAFVRWPQRVFGAMLSIFAGIALVVSAVGLYAVTAHSVALRTQEIGVRMALGALPSQVRWMVMRGAITQIAVGLALGCLGALGVGQILQGGFVSTSPHDPITLGVAMVVLVGVAVVACLVPVRRASRLDPVNALRWE